LKGPCAKQEVTAIILMGSDIILGSNWCGNSQQECPRRGLPTGEGYELCKSICKQENHAEVDACKKINKIKGGIMFIIGHYYCCDECKRVMDKCGIKKVYFV